MPARGSARMPRRASRSWRDLAERPGGSGCSLYGGGGGAGSARVLDRQAARESGASDLREFQGGVWVAIFDLFASSPPMRCHERNPSSSCRSHPGHCRCGATARPPHAGQCNVRRPMVCATHTPANWLYSNGSRCCSAIASRWCCPRTNASASSGERQNPSP